MGAGIARMGLSLALALVLTIYGLPEILAADLTDLKADEWNIETVDSEGEVGLWTSIALDSKDYPHISYLEESGKVDLKYARWTGSSWATETVDSIGAVGDWSSLSIDSNDNPHISYYNRLGGELRYAKWTGSSWNIETIDTGGGVGMYTSIALDSNDNPHISYSGLGLKYARWIGNSWVVEKVDTRGEFTSIALDSSDYPGISYFDPLSVDLKYAKWDGSAWNIEVVNPEGGVYTSLALDSNENPHISYYYAGGRYELGYAKRIGGKWTVETIDSPATGAHCSLAIDSKDNIHISYLNRTDGDKLKYAKWTGSEWSIETIDINDDGMFTSIAVDRNDDPHISYFNRRNRDLKYASRADLGPPLRSVSVDIDPDTLNLRSMGRWVTAYLSTEGAKAEDIDTSSLLLNDVIRPEWWEIQNDTTLMVKFSRSAVQTIVPISAEVDIKVTGRFKDGERFEVHDTIRVIGPGNYREMPESLRSREGVTSPFREEYDFSQVAGKPMEGFRP